MRTFIAINLPKNLQIYLQKLQQKIQKDNPNIKVKWVEPENFHLCLQFIGEVADLNISALTQRLEKIIRFNPFKIHLSHIDCFPNHFHPRVIYVSVEEPTAKLYILQKAIHHFLLSRGYKLDRKPFKPHLTLGRLKYQTSFLRLPKKIKSLSFQVSKIALMSSYLTPQGPIYKTIAIYG